MEYKIVAAAGGHLAVKIFEHAAGHGAAHVIAFAKNLRAAAHAHQALAENFRARSLLGVRGQNARRGHERGGERPAREAPAAREKHYETSVSLASHKL